MAKEIAQQRQALEAAVAPTFFRYLLTSMTGLIAMTSASLVDGIFIGNYVGVPALAAVNLIIPIMALSFGVAIMVGVGGSVRGGKYLGENNIEAASSIFSKTLSFMVLYGLVAIGTALLFERKLFFLLGAGEELFPVMSDYYRIVTPFLFAQFITIVLYFFVRLDGMPSLAAFSLALGAIVNIVLDYLFIAEYGWGLKGAALATGLSEVCSMIILLSYFFRHDRTLQFKLWQSDWIEVLQSAYNGISEFINEVSGGIITFIFNWMLIQRAGVSGVAAITVVNYALMVGFMVFWGISDTIQVMVSQNFGARKAHRIIDFLKTAVLTISLLSLASIATLLTFSESIILLFIGGTENQKTVFLATEFLFYVWPLFIFAGFNMLISGYLTAIHRPFQSGLVAVCRSLILPAGLLMLFYTVVNDFRFVVALPVAEGLTFLLAAAIFLKNMPIDVVTKSTRE